ncbi:hypothetical protein, partial [Pseudomonas amygdali]|uniref:hypothetical protein n=1 Tax=Pseudomonas amygdali TaxID=47877 RepID=UPI0019565EA4
VTGETDLSRATDYGIGAPGASKNPQINLLTKLQRSTQNWKATQRGDQVLKRRPTSPSSSLKFRLFQQNRPKAPGHESGVGSAGQAAALKTLSDQQLIGAKGYLSVD